ncbi:FAS1 domain-containing protein [Dioscorea alata]|uniref:FAS1 domain-containing protein n=1 Tax=Dioscorea alata TaxID=55571 RepID=A0ACB7UV62_DIOAL|nr:FAS1 domain-containing protein [Dioscorea alata]
MAKERLLTFVLVVTTAMAVNSPAGEAHNITAVLESLPDYSIYNNYLTNTKLADEINSKETVTCLVLPNAAMATLASKGSPADIKRALSLLILLDYFDPSKLHNLGGGSTYTTTLLQTTGTVTGTQGFVNITDARGGKVSFSSAVPGSKPDAVYTKSIKEIPYSLSVLEISDPIVYPGLFDDGSSISDSNLTALLENTGCKTFASLISSSGVLQTFQSAMGKGLTVLAPNDEAFKAPIVPDLSKLSAADLVALLQYHALPSYTPKASLKMETGPIATMASNGPGKYDLRVKYRGDEVSLVTGIDTSRIASTVLDDTPVCVLTVDNVLLPIELFPNATAPAPGPSAKSPSPSPSSSPSPSQSPSPSLAPGPTAVAPAPAPGGKKKPEAPSPLPISPPAPPTESPAPASSPAESPENQPADDTSMAAGTMAGTLAAAFVSALSALGFIL